MFDYFLTLSVTDVEMLASKVATEESIPKNSQEKLQTNLQVHYIAFVYLMHLLILFINLILSNALANDFLTKMIFFG